MKNVIKKISAITMAFTLLGTGTAISMAIAPLSANTLIVSAAFNSYNGTVKTQGSNLNVRSGPGTNYTIVRKLSNGSGVTIYEENNGWGRISGSQEWVSLSYITPDIIHTPSYNPTSNSDISNKILNNTSLGLSDAKKRTMASLANTLYNAGYEVSFIAGLLGNIASEGSFGKFESSAYISYPEKEPDYLRYMDTYYNYRKEYSGQYITNKSLSKVYSIICELDKKGYRDKGSRCGFGLGCAQWTFERTKGLIEKYRSVAGYRDSITSEEVMLAEGLYMIDELSFKFRSVYTNWKNSNASLNSEAAARNAGKIICTDYEKPTGYNNKQKARGDMAVQIYRIIR